MKRLQEISVLSFQLAALAAAGFLGTMQPVAAEEFKSAKECVPGRRVIDQQNRSGKIIGIDRWSAAMCEALMDDTGKAVSHLFWMYHDESGSRETNDRLATGIYECFAGNPNMYVNMDLQIVIPHTYQWAGETGRFHVEPSRKIVFETGPLQKYTSHLLAGPTVGLNTDGGSFYGTHCDLKK